MRVLSNFSFKTHNSIYTRICYPIEEALNDSVASHRVRSLGTNKLNYLVA